MSGTKRTVSSLTATAARYRRLRHVVMLAATGAAVLSLGSTYAHAATGGAASVNRFVLTFTETFETALPECFDPDLIGTAGVTTTVTGQSVETSSGVFTVHGATDVTYRVDFPNGMYAVGTGEVDHFSFTANGSVVVNTVAIRDPHNTIFAADGTPIVQVVIHAVSHITYHDLNGDFEPQSDEISASVDRFVLTCH